MTCEATICAQNPQLGAAQTVSGPTGNVDHNGGSRASRSLWATTHGDERGDVTTLPGRRPTGASAGGCPAAHEDLGQLARKYSLMARWTTSETLTCSLAARISSARSSSGSSLTD